MKNYILFTLLISSLFLILSCNKTIDGDQEKGNINMNGVYLNYKGENFTGTFLSKYPGTTQLEIKFEYKDGLRDGKQLEYYNNGQVKEESETVNGRYNGVVLKYWENGRIKSKENYIMGDLDGVNEDYDENGRSILYRKYFNKQLIESNEYDGAGKLSSKYFVKGDSSIREEYDDKGKVYKRIINGVSVN
jgi:antitoxin component YwqK of YwqJK toxin-antitoxin module